MTPDKKYGFVYLTTCLVNGLIYIGQCARSPNVEYYGSGHKIRASLDKYGRDNHARAIIDWASDAQELNILECLWIQKYDSANPNIGMNISNGGNRRRENSDIDEVMSDEVLSIYNQIDNINSSLEAVAGLHIGQSGLVGMRLEDWLP